ncbi:uncharacterized protein LOC133833141 [Humulus lupulus]|uniref:uncharacterized protein LOC133833141 n=1 Tax=Humulus lupulus TaxID=3486 RepID=UPI002B40B481|nr:uncharacterized protein LOC133833141 [Humulus lupulus]
MKDESTSHKEPKYKINKLEEINLAENPEEKKPVFISADLPVAMRGELIELLYRYRDVFAWTYEDMLGLDPKLVTHNLSTLPETRPIKQTPRNYRPEIQLQIKTEIEKLLKAGFIRTCKHPIWLANIVPVKKKNGKIRICVDYRDLNRACPKDDFPLPNLDTLIDATSNCEMFSFMDGFSGYNQIQMAQGDAEKTAFRTPFGNFYYSVMPFGLKNASATYQRAMTAIFHDMIHESVEVYVDDIVVKSQSKFNHIHDLEKEFQRCRKYKLKMNPLKCAFGVNAGKFLGFVVHKNGISIDEDKTKAILAIRVPQSSKELKSFLGKVSYLRRFIPALSKLTSPLQTLMQKGVPFGWGEKQQSSFDKIKTVLSSPQAMIAPLPKVPLLLYLAVTETSIGTLLAQEVDGKEKPVYYLSRRMKGAEINYPYVEKLCLALVYTAQRLRHYLVAHKVVIMTKADPIKFMLNKPIPSSRIARWILMLSEFDISVMYPRAQKSQALSDLLTYSSNNDKDWTPKEIPGGLPEAMVCDDEIQKKWVITFDGSSTSNGGGAGIVLTNPEGKNHTQAYKLSFDCTNNEAEYEALIFGMTVVLNMEVKRVVIKGDSKLIIQQVKGEFSVKEPSLAIYRAMVQESAKNFQECQFEHMPRTQNIYVDALATMASKVEVSETQNLVCKIINQKCSVILAYKRGFELEEWQQQIVNKLTEPKVTSFKERRHFIMIKDTLYHRSSDGVLARCLKQEEVIARMEEIHDITCGIEGPKLLRRLQRAGYYWENMEEDAASLQKDCPNCQLIFNSTEAILITEIDDWRRPYQEYFRDKVTPYDKKEKEKLLRHISKYCLKDNNDLYRKGFNGKLLRCISNEEAEEVMKEIHHGDCGEHQGGRKLYEEVVRIGYYWPTMEMDAMKFARECQKCQIFGNKIHAPAISLQSVTTPWPFHTWAMDLIGPISPPSQGRIWILAATECFTKWAEAIPLKKASTETVATFILEHIICRFGIPKRILSDNGTPFTGKATKKLLEDYQISHGKSTRYYPQGNGIPEAFNKLLL